ncbi:FlgO family outer membrane protein [Paraglaciecola aquimarina]|uniref:FlgO family outer membrane protein n=1 Tax=Paraglaciecola aquimarina TaxID=1235557 RepID=A0ABU3SXK9_9ALTE|nr:FlgO family outer membrane protein [Paraglaciecola aquimarina]MDU0354657.1 FlgO family outer membrane protein [Paraglaciecola aquimarina]
MKFTPSSVLVNLSAYSCTLLLSSCALFEPGQNTTAQDTMQHQETAQISTVDQNADPLQSSMAFQKQFQNSETRNSHALASPKEMELLTQQQHLQAKLDQQNSAQYDINYYARGMMQDLMANLEYVNATTPVAVTSFVMLDSNYNEYNILGNQLAESLIHEVHKFGIPVIDYKTTGYIRVTEQGDFAFSKDYQDFSGDMPARYIVSGTMLRNADGYLVNARIIGIKSQAVVASAQSLIPYHIADPIIQMASQSTATTEENAGLNLRMNNTGLSKAELVKVSSANRITLVQE